MATRTCIARYLASFVAACLVIQSVSGCQRQVIESLQKGTPAPVTTQQAAGQTALVRKRRASTTTELRGVWITNVDSTVLNSPEKLTEAMQKLARLNFTTVYPVVWNQGFTLYPSEVMREVTGIPLSTRDEGLQGRDIIAEMVKLGHELDLDVVPWFEYGMMLPANSELAKRKPEWLTQDVTGAKVFGADGAQNVYLNPFHPEVQVFMARMVTEVVAKYNIDGIQFDDHFSLSKKFGYDAYTVNLYKNENGGRSPPQSVDDPAWVQWRCDKMTAFVAMMSQNIQAIKLGFKFSVSPNPPDFAKLQFLQDWIPWRDRGYVKEIVVQVYRYELEAFGRDVANPQLQSKATNSSAAIGIISGLRTKPVSMSSIVAQVQKARQAKASGVVFFFYESLFSFPASGETKESREAALAQLFAQPAKAP